MRRHLIWPVLLGLLLCAGCAPAQEEGLDTAGVVRLSFQEIDPVCQSQELTDAGVELLRAAEEGGSCCCPWRWTPPWTWRTSWGSTTICCC